MKALCVKVNLYRVHAGLDTFRTGHADIFSDSSISPGVGFQHKQQEVPGQAKPPQELKVTQRRTLRNLELRVSLAALI